MGKKRKTDYWWSSDERKRKVKKIISLVPDKATNKAVISNEKLLEKNWGDRDKLVLDLGRDLVKLIAISLDKTDNSKLKISIDKDLSILIMALARDQEIFMDLYNDINFDRLMLKVKAIMKTKAKARLSISTNRPLNKLIALKKVKSKLLVKAWGKREEIDWEKEWGENWERDLNALNMEKEKARLIISIDKNLAKFLSNSDDESIKWPKLIARVKAKIKAKIKAKKKKAKNRLKRLKYLNFLRNQIIFWMQNQPVDLILTCD